MPERWPDRALALVRWAFAACLAGTITFVVDRVWAAIFSSGRIRWHWIHATTLWGGHVTLAVLLVAVGAIVLAITHRLPRGWAEGRLRGPLLQGLLVGIGLAVPMMSLGRSLAAGPWISEQWFAPLVVMSPVAMAMVAVPLALRLTAPDEDARTWRRRGRIVLLAGFISLALNVDHWVSPGLYPEFHILVECLITATTIVGLPRLFAELERARVVVPRRLVLVVGVVGPLVATSLWFGMSPTTRGGLVLRSPFARAWIRRAMPEPPSTLLRDTLAVLDVRSGEFVGPSRAPATAEYARDPKWNVVLVVADTMRADALPPARPAEGLEFAQPGDTPRIEEWLQGAYQFEFAYSPATETKRAMPAIFRSIESSDNPLTTGIPVGDRMEALGVTPVAAVHRYFMPAKYPPVAALLDGFSTVRVYENSTTDSAVPLALQLANSVADQQFMLFLHLYTLHLPGFDGQVIGRGPDDGTRQEKYRRTLQYLDGQFGALLDGLDHLGLRDRTIIVFIGDHGEGMGDHGQMLHGPNVFDEDVRVPFAIAIPGQPGGLIRETVGTIDVVPTLFDLLAVPPDGSDRGRSLVPLLASGESEPMRPYYFENSEATTVGVVVGRDKLIYEKGLGVAYRFDLVADPDEYADIHDADALHESLLRTLLQFKPEIAVEELADEETLALVRARLGEVDPAAPGAVLPLLVKLVALDPQPELVERCAEIFRETQHADVRLLLARYLVAAAPESMSPVVGDWLKELRGDPTELEIVSALARQGQAAFAPVEIAERMNEYALRGAPSTWEPWLRLVRPWTKPAEEFVGPLSRMLGRTKDESVPPVIIELILENIASLEGYPQARQRLLSGVNRSLASSEPRVRAAAVRVLGSLGDDRARKTVVKKLLDKKEDIRVRREAASALTALAGDGALPDLAKAAKQSSMTTLVIRHLRDHGTLEAIPVLDQIHQDNKEGDTRGEARNAISAIRARAELSGAGESTGG